jgi:biopolymer transport protein ExbB
MDITASFLAFTLLGATWVLWLLVALSVLSIAVMIERAWFFARHRVDARILAADMRELLDLEHEAPSADAVNAALSGAKSRERQRFERRLAFLGTLGSNAPFIGLFGTVLGIIKAFHDLAGNQAGGAQVVMAGISEALVSTAVGLLVAIPAVVAYNTFNRLVRKHMGQVEWMSHLALEHLKAPTGEGS